MKIPIFIFSYLLWSSVAFSQLAPFTLVVNSTNEFCLNNGTLSATTQNTTSGATITFQVFKLPNTTVPISTSASTNGLSAGSYQVVATQTLITPTETQTNEQTATATITNQIVNLNFNITKSDVSSCGAFGTIIVNTVAGTPVSYEIISGPSTAPAQSSNEFPGLSAGKYQIRVFDNCGNSARKDYTLILIDPALSISGVSTPPILSSCTSLEVKNTIVVANGTNIAYPLQVVFTIHPPNGAPDIITNETLTGGNPTTFDYIQNVPINSNMQFTYDVQFTDACGKTYSKLGNIINPKPRATLSDIPGICGAKFLNVAVTNFLPPFTINFLQSPPGFNPTVYNGGHPGPFQTSPVFYGALTLAVPFGIYEVEITDGCGRTDTANFDVRDVPVIPVSIGRNNGCGAVIGSITVTVPDGRKIVSAIITNAPSNYNFILPNNVSSFINPETGALLVTNLPIGLYDFTIVDDCGDTHLIVAVEVPAFVLQGLNETVLPNCVVGSGSLSLNSGNGNLMSINITSGPSNYSLNYPQNVTPNIKDGVLYLSNLPEGSYTFAGTDSCGYALTKTFFVIGYNRLSPGFSVQRNCGAFDLTMVETSNGTNQALYYLQKLNPTTNNWEHPFTNVTYLNGSVPTATTGFLLANNATIFNINVKGIFRILKTFQTFDFGTAVNIGKICIDDLGQFDYTGELQILGAYNLACEGGSGNTSMVIDVLGVPPYNFSIIEKDGNPFFVNNGTNNTFTGLSAGSYLVSVTDNCEGRAGLFTLGTLTSLVKANQPADILDCRTDVLQTNIFDLTLQNSTILGNQNPNNFQITYHLNAADATNGTNAISNPNFFINTSNPQTIHARVSHRTIAGCIATKNFKIFIGRKPKLTVQPSLFICDNNKLLLSADAGYDQYLWSTGATTREIVVTAAGVYKVIASNVYGTLSCSDQTDISVVLSGTANLISVTTQDWTDNTNSITVAVNGNGTYEYSLDNNLYQTSNIFSNLFAGYYTVYIKDVKGQCGTITEVVVLLNYPKFFTPNGDSYNEFWKVKFSELEPNFYTYIYDRYGKLLSGFDISSPGWNGIYNNQPMPADDYWFVINRQDGKVYKGHFTLKR